MNPNEPWSNRRGSLELSVEYNFLKSQEHWITRSRRPITKGTSSAALKRLQEGGLILKFEHGLYQIQDDALADWLRNQELDE
jgi:hypothetical protein